MISPAHLLVSLALAAGTCPEAIPSDAKPDHAALQACLDKGGLVALEPGEYLIAAPMYLTRNGTQLTSADPANKARLVADVDLYDTMLRASRPENYVISHIVFDGRIHERRKASKCKGYRGGGTNLFTQGKGYQLLDIESTGSLCGSALQAEGSDYEIAGCRIHDNGSTTALSPGVPEPWSDGLTLLSCERGKVHGNKLSDNTDINLVVGGGHDCVIEGNTIEQTHIYGFAGLHIWNFDLSGKGDHAGSVYRKNTITAAKDTLAFGIGVGGHAWSSTTHVHDAGTVTQNVVRGAVVGLAVDGIEKGTVTGNDVKESRGSDAMYDCTKSANYTAGHFGEAKLDPGYVGRVYHDGNCQDLKPQNGAVFVRQTVPPRLKAGAAATATLVFRNTGAAEWKDSGGYKLGAQAPNDNLTFRSGRVRLGSDATVGNGAEYAFTVPFKAPARAGTYVFQWRLVQEKVEWFGQSSKAVSIVVTKP